MCLINTDAFLRGEQDDSADESGWINHFIQCTLEKYLIKMYAF